MYVLKKWGSNKENIVSVAGGYMGIYFVAFFVILKIFLIKKT